MSYVEVAALSQSRVVDKTSEHFRVFAWLSNQPFMATIRRDLIVGRTHFEHYAPCAHNDSDAHPRMEPTPRT